MKAYECYANILTNRQLSVPLEIMNKLKASSKIRVKIFVEDEDSESEWDNFSMSQFFNGYSEKDAIYDSL